ncbi:MAG: electron transport complex subunit RsxC [Bacillota bacterium]
MKRLAGVNPPHHKTTADSVPRRIPVPAEVTLPMLMHIGAPSKPVVKPGDEVKVYQLIAEAGGFVSSPVYSSVSGKVKSIGSVRLASGQNVPAVVVESDGLQRPYEGISAPTVTNLQEFLAAVRDSGVVGLGGAGFPTAVKLTTDDISRFEYIIVNGAECEPYVTSDTRTMIDDKDLVWEGVLLLKKYFHKSRIIIGIEDNKPACIKGFQELCAGAEGVEVFTLPSKYPQGGEKVLVYQTTGRIVPEDKLPLDVNTVVINCTTLAVIARYVKTGVPLVEKCVTVDGSAVKEPQNVIAPIGTPIKNLFDFCGGFVSEPKKILYGGPMMGTAVSNLDEPLLKNNNAVLAFNEKDSQLPEETECIRCGRCVDHCPMHLMPVFIESAYKLKRADLLERHKVNICMECGCCAYVCPARRRLVQVMKLSKPILKEYLSEKAKKAKREEKEAVKA